MGGAMKQQSLIHKSLSQFAVCVAVLLLLATPAFYWLTKNFYAEDMADLVEAVQRGATIPANDLEEDIIKGIVLQFGLITCVFGVGIVVMLRIISARLWRPFDGMLREIENFRLESGTCVPLPQSDVKEFNRLGAALTKLMSNSLASYHAQKEFTENASHEMQTPLAVYRSKLDLLLQLPQLTSEQAAIIQDLYKINSRMARLNRNLLLLAKIDNNQYAKTDDIEITGFIDAQLPYLAPLATQLQVRKRFAVPSAHVKANRPLFECMTNNLIVNAARHNTPGGEIVISVTGNTLAVTNTSSEPQLDDERIFNRFYRPEPSGNSNGLGLSIVKAICDYHGWQIAYTFSAPQHTHTFTVRFA